MLSRVITAVYDDALAEVGLKVSQFSVLNAVASREETRPAELAKVLGMDESTLSRNVERMRARGWLEVVPGADARTQSFRLTPQGRRMLERAFPAWERAQQKAEQLLGENGVALLANIAGRMGGP